jgi:hypothetical protein
MGRKMGLFVPVVLMVGIFFFLMIGIQFLNQAPAPDVNRTPTLAESANETVPFREPVQIGWQGAMYAVVACGALAVAGFFVKKLGI